MRGIKGAKFSFLATALQNFVMGDSPVKIIFVAKVTSTHLIISYGYKDHG